MRSVTIFTLVCVVLFAAVWCFWRRTAAVSISSTGDRNHTRVSKDVDYRYFAEGSPEVGKSDSDALILDVDLTSPNIRLQVTADGAVRRKGGKVFGISHTVRDWCAMNQAIAGVNGGFFGETVPDGIDKQAEGLLVVGGKVYNPGRWVKSTRRPGERFLRCALGIQHDGVPQIGWATCQPDGQMLMYDRPLSPAGSRRFGISSAVACGPRLVVAGKVAVSDDKERLVSSLALPRTFVAYDYATDNHSGERRPRHFVMGIAMQMTYHEVAQFLQNYFRNKHGVDCAEAMCLDGGAPSQLVYRTLPQNRTIQSESRPAEFDWIDTRPSHVTVPTALLVVNRAQ